jgi:hypothetical protein
MRFALERRQAAFIILGIGRVPACTEGLRDEACGGVDRPHNSGRFLICPLLRQGLGPQDDPLFGGPATPTQKYV